MTKALYLVFSLLIFIFLISFVVAGDVAYIYKKSFRIDHNVISVFSELGLSTDLIHEENLKTTDLSSYRFIFVGDENFRNGIPVNDYPSVVINSWHGDEWGLTDNEGVSILGSNQPLHVTVDGSLVQVYSQATFGIGDPAIPYYYLGNNNKAPSLIRVAGTQPVPSGGIFGDVVSIAPAGAILFNRIQNADLCYYGIVESDYWTQKARDLFITCTESVITQCTEDTECPDDEISDPYCRGLNLYQNITSYSCNLPGSINASCISNTREELLENCPFGCSPQGCLSGNHDVALIDFTHSQGGIKLEQNEVVITEMLCNEDYQIVIKAENLGDFTENVTYQGNIGSISFSHVKTNNLDAGVKTGEKERTVTVNLNEGFYNITVIANVSFDSNLSNNIAMRQVFVSCSVPECENNYDCSDGLFCNGKEICNLQSYTCEQGIPPTKDDGVSCTIDSCDEINDIIVNYPDDNRCDNGLFCDGNEYCNSYLDCQPGIIVECGDDEEYCDDKNLTTIDHFCNELINSCDEIKTIEACEFNCDPELLMCVSEFCGNNIIDLPEEECDDGNDDNFDLCRNNCKAPYCGDFITDPLLGEECDDGISVRCFTQDGYLGVQTCNLQCLFDTCITHEFCSDGIINGNEQCDDGNLIDGDGCTSLCKVEEIECLDDLDCSDLNNEFCLEVNIMEVEGKCIDRKCQVSDPKLVEDCEFSDISCKENNLSTRIGFCEIDSVTCQIQETIIPDHPFCLAQECGNGIIEFGEQCDDGNLIDGDGCNSLCQNEEFECEENIDCSDLDNNFCSGTEIHNVKGLCVDNECTVSDPEFVEDCYSNIEFCFDKDLINRTGVCNAQGPFCELVDDVIPDHPQCQEHECDIDLDCGTTIKETSCKIDEVSEKTTSYQCIENNCVPSIDEEILATSFTKTWTCGSGLSCEFNGLYGNFGLPLYNNEHLFFINNPNTWEYNCGLTIREGNYGYYDGDNIQRDESADIYVDGLFIGNTGDQFCNVETPDNPSLTCFYKKYDDKTSRPDKWVIHPWFDAESQFSGDLSLDQGIHTIKVNGHQSHYMDYLSVLCNPLCPA